MFTKLNDEGGAESTEVFASGWLNESTGAFSGRPLDVVELQDGSILVSDDLVGAIYRDGSRKSEVMNIVVKMLTDRNIENLAAYCESLNPGGAAA